MSFSAFFVAAAIAHAPAEPETASEYADVAERQYADGSYAAASASYAAAFERDAVPDYLYGWAQAERRAGNCPRAVQLYREYAALEVSEAARAAAEKNSLRCGASIEPDPGAKAAASESDAPPPAAPTDRGVDPWTRDVPAISLLATGGAIGVVAVVLAIGSAKQRRDAERADVEVDYGTHAERSRVLRTGAIVCASLGAAVVVGGIVRYIVVARSARAPRVSWQPGTGLRF